MDIKLKTVIGWRIFTDIQYTFDDKKIPPYNIVEELNKLEDCTAFFTFERLSKKDCICFGILLNRTNSSEDDRELQINVFERAIVLKTTIEKKLEIARPFLTKIELGRPDIINNFELC